MDDLISIIIINYNTEELLEECIASIKEKTIGANYEIIVVDNNSADGSLNSLISSYPDIIFKLEEKNYGFGVANNIGATIAKGKYLFFLNPDTLLVNDAISVLYRYMEANNNVAICGGNLYKGDMKPASSYHVMDFLLFEYKIIFNIHRPIGFNYTNTPKEVDVIVGADLFIRSSLFTENKGFDSDFFMYFEEVELCNRIQKKGYKIVSVPEAKIVHFHGGSAENKNEELNKWSYQEHWYSKFLYFSKVKGNLITKCLYLTNKTKIKSAKLFYSVLRDNGKMNYWNKKEQIILDAYIRYKTKKTKNVK